MNLITFMKTFKSLDNGCTWTYVTNPGSDTIITKYECTTIGSSTTEFWNMELSTGVKGKWEKANDEITTHIKFITENIVVSFYANLNIDHNFNTNLNNLKKSKIKLLF